MPKFVGLVGGLTIVTSLMALVMRPAVLPEPVEPRTIICDANSEVPVNKAGEYPAWELRCDSDIRVVVID